MRMGQQKKEPEEELIRIIWCDFCEAYRKFNTGREWFSCSVCKRCYTCLSRRTEKCELCIKWDAETAELRRKAARELRQEKNEIRAKDLMTPIVERKKKV